MTGARRSEKGNVMRLRNQKKKLGTASLCAFLLAGTLAGCNTVKGVGRDIQKGGEVVEDAAQKTGRAVDDAVSKGPAVDRPRVGEDSFRVAGGWYVVRY